MQSLRQYALLWLLFFFICFGLGYPTLNRYDPAHADGLSDAIVYQQMVTGSPGARPRAEIFGGRVLVPYTARLFYRAFGARVGTWNPVAFSLLMASSLFCATAALLLVIVGQFVTKLPGVALLAAALYLLSFAVPNFQLSGLIDSGESLFMLALAWALLSGRWWPLPVLGVFGVAAKETFMPFAIVFAVVWWIADERQRSRKFVSLAWIASMIVLSNIALALVRLWMFGHVVWPWQIAASMNSGGNFLSALARCVTDRSFWYVFVWLLPLGLWGLRRVPRPWVWASVVTAFVALFFGAYNDMAGTVARPIFSIMGPILSLSVAILITRGSGPRAGPAMTRA